MLKERLLQDYKEAMKNKEEVRKNTITIVRSAILQIEKDEQIEVDDTKILEIISKEVKKRKEALVDYEKTGREDLINQLNSEIAFLKAYLPQELGEDEVRNIVKEAIDEANATSIKDMGKVMQIAKTKAAGRADNKFINDIVKEFLH